jgi:GTP cyclohydrolase IA
MSKHTDPTDPIEPLVAQLLKELGEESGRDGLARTPARVARSLRFLTSGYQQDPVAILNDALFDVSYDEMVIVKDVDFYSLCEHHMLPFFGHVHVAYVPNGKVVGLSKIPRLVGMFARRLQVQERLTTQIAETLEAVLEPKGVAVVCESIHLCMMMRGVEQQSAFAITSSLRGEFQTDSKTRAEFMDLIRHKKESFA